MTDYRIIINVCHDKFGRPLLSFESEPNTPAEKGIVKDIVKLLNSYLDGNGN